MAVVCGGNVLCDGKYTPCLRISRAALIPASYSCIRDKKLCCNSSVILKSSYSCRPRRLCVVSNTSNSRWNADFSRQRKGTSKGKSRQFQEPEQSETSEETEFISNNGSLLSAVNNPRYQATATPGKREKEIVELFRKVQAQLRERAALKEEKKIEAAQQGQNERGTVDSLLNLLRKHSVDQKKKSATVDDFNLGQPDRTNSFEDESNFDVLQSNKEIDEEVTPPATRPASNFRRKSPVPRVKFQPVFSICEETSSFNSLKSQGKGKKVSKDEPKVEAKEEPTLSDAINEESLDDPSGPFDSSDATEDANKSTEKDAACDISSLKLVELRELAKARQIKGYSKLKKSELVDLLSG